MRQFNVKTWLLITSWIVLSVLLAWCWQQTNNWKVSWDNSIKEWHNQSQAVVNKTKNQFSAEEKSIKKEGNKAKLIKKTNPAVNNNVSQSYDNNIQADNNHDVKDTIDPNSMISSNTNQDKPYVASKDTVWYNVNKADNINKVNYNTISNQELKMVALEYVNNYIQDREKITLLNPNIKNNIREKTEIISKIKLFYNRLCKKNNIDNNNVCRKLQGLYNLLK